MPTPGSAVNLIVDARFKAAVIPRLNAMPTILLIDKLVKVIAQVATSLKTSMWGNYMSAYPLSLRNPKCASSPTAPLLTTTRWRSRRSHTPTSPR